MKEPFLTSTEIDISRPILIFFIVLNHLSFINKGIFLNIYDFYLKATDLSLTNFTVTISKTTFTLGAVPLLSIISGYLAYVSINHKNYKYTKLIFKKIKRLIIPFLSVNIVFMFYSHYIFESGIDINKTYQINLWSFFKNTLYLKKLPAVEALYFIRDLFFCFLFLPIVKKIYSLNKLVYISFTAYLFYLFFLRKINLTPFTFLEYIPFIRVDIFFFFCIGYYIKKSNFSISLNRKLSYLIVLSYSIFCIFISIFYIENDISSIFNYLARINIMFGLFTIYIIIKSIKKVDLLKKGLCLLSPTSYYVYLLHVPIQVFFHRRVISILNEHNIYSWFSYHSIILTLMLLLPSLLYFIIRELDILMRKYLPIRI